MKEDYRFNHRLQLLDPRWKKRAKQIRDIDKVCQKCNSEYYLKVHHKYYISGRKLWEYPDSLLILLCDKCHSKEHKDLKTVNEIMKDCSEFLFADEILEKIDFLRLPFKLKI